MKKECRQGFREKADAVRTEVEKEGYIVSGAEYEIICYTVRKYYEQDWMTDEEVLRLLRIALIEHCVRIRRLENELGEFFSTLNEPFLHRCSEKSTHRKLGGRI